MWECDASSQWSIYQTVLNILVEKGFQHKNTITTEMQKFILQLAQRVISLQPILSNMRHATDVVTPTRGWSTQAQMTNCTKYLRKLEETKNSIHEIRQVVQKNSFDPPGNHVQAFSFGYQDDENGHVYMGNGTDEDWFVVGVTSIALVHACIEYASEGRFTLFHATFKLSNLGYRMITCEFLDAERKYQLGAIFVVSR
ncbi:hypothetical protein PHMEG_00016026 [Phytophthora megakarya]|uniref:Uncharacterized protein n=1 Tax=Phytophthora megakarya TaxID=4795 RepID=A0A225W0W5_9STRA|nr:hypothetical protein PHMEG_00016026 [Phytophthora megakarya]